MNILAKIGRLVKKYQKDIFLGFCIVLIAFIGFNIGQINALRKTPTETSMYPTETVLSPVQNKIKAMPTQPKDPKDPRVVVSKVGTSKKYHFTWCPGAKKIKEANKIWFENESLAQKAGYTLAGNCQ